MTKKLALLFIPLLLVAGYFLFNQPNNSQKSLDPSPTPTEEQPVSFSASFKIVTLQTTRIFTDTKYHNLSQDVYIDPSDTTKVQVRKKGITWNDFFKTLPMEIDKECLTTGTGQIFCTGDEGTLRFFINESEDANALDKEIKNEDSLLVTFEK